MDVELWKNNAERFFKKVDVRGRSECWPWTATISKHHGTGLFRLVKNGRPTSPMAHYLASYILHFGEKERRLRIMASCGNHLCCNPEHLYATESRSPQKRSDKRSYDEHLLDKFWAKVRRGGEDDCWIWTGLLAQFGHGIFCRTKGSTKTDYAHRFIFYSVYPNTDPAAHICHHCDVPACVNVKHLYAGSSDSNVKDRNDRGRNGTTRGEQSKKAKLTEEDVLTIRAFYKAGMYNAQRMAKKYNVSISCIEAVVRRTTWRHI